MEGTINKMDKFANFQTLPSSWLLKYLFCFCRPTCRISDCMAGQFRCVIQKTRTCVLHNERWQLREHWQEQRDARWQGQDQEEYEDWIRMSMRAGSGRIWGQDQDVYEDRIRMSMRTGSGWVWGQDQDEFEDRIRMSMRTWSGCVWGQDQDSYRERIRIIMRTGSEPLQGQGSGWLSGHDQD
jgi:hypothetical protein